MNIKKLALASAMLTAVALPAHADLLGVYAGVQGWKNEPTGGFAQNVDAIDFSFDSQTNVNMYLKFEHPIPLIPNARVRLGDLEGTGATNLTSPFIFSGETYSDADVLNTAINLTNNDATLYWELLDNDLIGFDFGFTVKQIEGDFVVNNGTTSSTEGFSKTLPMAYAAAKVRVPFLGVYVYADANLIALGDYNAHDFEVGAGYDLIDNMLVDVALTFGYRQVVLELDDVDNVTTDIDFSGFFAGLEVHF